MTLKDYLNGLSRSAQKDFALRCGSTLGYLRKAISVGQTLRAPLCVAIERESGHAVTRPELREDWQAVWPELVIAQRR